MQIYLARNNQQAGPYSLEQLNQMLANQQVLLTDLAWHQGMAEWKALGELTQGKLIYEPVGYTSSTLTQNNISTQPTSSEHHPSTIHKVHFHNTSEPELASIGSRALAKIIDLFLWLPAAIIPSFFFSPEQFSQLAALQQKIKNATNPEQVSSAQNQLVTLIPAEAWQAMIIYLLIMLVIQAYMLAKNSQSIGKKIAKIRIVDAESNEKVSLLRVFTLRSLVFIVLNLLFMPFVTIADFAFAIGKKRQTLHDKLAKTKVIK